MPRASSVSYLPPRVRAADRWADVHQVAVVALSLVSLAAAVVVAAQKIKSNTWLGRDVGAAVTAAVASAIAWYTTALVRWDQLALWAVTVGGDIDGYWTVAFDGGARFVLIDNTEVSQSSYRVALSLHLVTPVLAMFGLAYLAVGLAKRARTAGADSVMAIPLAIYFAIDGQTGPHEPDAASP